MYIAVVLYWGAKPGKRNPKPTINATFYGNSLEDAGATALQYARQQTTSYPTHDLEVQAGELTHIVEPLQPEVRVVPIKGAGLPAY